MKKLLFLMAFLGIAVVAGAQKQFVIDPNAEMRKVSGGYDAIIVSGGIDLYLTQSDKEELAVSASNSEYASGIRTTVENNTLKIYYEGEKGWSGRNRQMKAYVSFIRLKRLEASGASDVVVAGEIKGESLSVKLTGASEMKGRVELADLSLELSGASDVNISGTATTVKIESSGASDVKGYGLVTDMCTAKASGASDINITVNKELNAHASGASDIYYKGNAVIRDVQSTGASTVARKN